MVSDGASSGPGPDERRVVRRYSLDRGEHPSTGVLLVLDELPGYDVDALDNVLHDRVDPDALDALFHPVSGADRDAGKVTFPVDGYEVTLRAAGEVVVRTAPSSE